ncbi:hypothetical protein MMC18_009631 [Xylographa bjoerkii]|nr:hypothetical protein [Xylographa bjoerkii]
MTVEFWHARIAASGLRQTEARIPLVPDQSRFLEKWFEWHRGYRLIRHDSGRVEHQALLGENLADVAPGYLPRTVDELRAGVTSRSLVDETVEEGSLNPLVQSVTATEDLDIDPEDRIFDLTSTPNITDHHTLSSTTLLTASTSSTIYSPPLTSSSTGQLPSSPQRLAIELYDRPIPIEDQFRRVAALRREVQCLRAGIERVMSGLQDLGETVPDSQNALQHTTNLTTRLGNIEAYLRSPGHTSPERMDFQSTMNQSSEEGFDAPQTSVSTAQPRQQVQQPSLPPHLPNRAHALAQSSRHTNRQGLSRPSVHTRGHSRASLGTQPSRNPPTDPQIARARSQIDAARVTEQLCQQQLLSATESQGQAAARLAAATVRLQECLRVLNRLERLERSSTALFGSREEIERQGNDYESPVAGLFRTYHGRYQAAEEQRRQERILPEILAAEERFVESTHDAFQLLGDDPIRTVDEVRQELAQGITRPRSAERTGTWAQFHSTPPEVRTPPELRTRRTERRMPRTTWMTNPLAGPTHVTHDVDDDETRPVISEASWSNTSATEFDTLLGPEASVLPESGRPYVHRRVQARSAEEGGGPGRQTEFQDYYRRMLAIGRMHSVDSSTPPLDENGRPTPRITTRYSNLDQMARDRARGLYHGQDVTMSDLERLIAANAGGRARREPTLDMEPKSLDKDDGRPEPITNEDDFMVKMECHCVMCKWCANEAIPSHRADQTIPQNRSACPVCRKRVKNKATIYGGESKDPKAKPDDAPEGMV